MATVSAQTLRSWTRSVLAAAGLTHAHASVVADNLSYAEQRGLASHGFTRLGIYLARIEAGGINPAAEPKIVHDQGALAVVDGEDACGAASAVFAVKDVIERAREHGIGCTAVRGGNHFGATGYYTDLIRDSGMVGIAVCNTDRVMTAPGGTVSVLGSNPLAISLPGLGESGPRMDMATTQVSLGKLIIAAEKGEHIPSGWAVDSSGSPTDDPVEGLKGGLVSAGGVKGYALAFMIDGLVSLSGAAISNNVGALYGDPARPQRLGFCFIAIAVPEPEQYAQDITELINAVHASGPTRDSKPVVMYPGEPEDRLLHSSKGYHALPSSIWDELQSAARRYDVSLVEEPLSVPHDSIR